MHCNALTGSRTGLLQWADTHFCKILHLTTDASNSGLGTVHYQVDQGRKRPIAYILRSLSATEDYATIEK